MTPQLSPAVLFEKSFVALGEAGLRETQATGYGVFTKTVKAPGLLRIAGGGDAIYAEALLEKQGAGSLLIFPLHTDGELDGFLAFSFKDRTASRQAEKPLNRIAGAVEKIWAARHLHASYRDVAERLGELDNRLIDAKIADRVQGLLTGDSHPELVETLVAHVNNVLRPSAALHTIETLAKDLENELEDRRVVAQAKAILQATHSFTEEQAYTHLRMLSRKSRQRIKDTALDVIATPARAAAAA